MMNPFDIFIPILINPLINLLLGLYNLADLFNLPGQLGFAIIFLTLLINGAIYPFKTAQLRSQKKLTEMRPHLAELKKKHGHDRKRHHEETLKLYQKHGYNAASGCLPLLIQLPVLFGLYAVFLDVLGKPAGQALGHLNSTAYFSGLKTDSLNEQFLGFNLGAIPNQAGLNAPIIAVIVATALLQFVLTKMSLPATTPKAGKDASFEETLAASQGLMVYIFPLLLASAAYSLPLGLALYWNVTSIFAIIQQYLIAGPGGLARWFPKK